MESVKHSNEDKKPGMPLTRVAFLRFRREVQVANNWIQLVEGSSVNPLSEPVPLESHLRQLTRWPEDWTEDPYFDCEWIVCWIPKIARKAYVRVQDIIEVKDGKEEQKNQ